MASILKVDKIRGTGLDSDSISIDGSGNITTTKTPLGFVPSGGILQTLHSESTTEVSSTSTSYADTGFNLSITPSSTSSKILIYFEFGSYFFGSNASNEVGVSYKLVRDSTDIKAYEDNGAYTMKVERGASNYWETFRTSLTHFDSPSTASAVNYKLQFARKIGGTATIKGVTKIILQEIAG